MAEHSRLGDFVLGLHGLAILRHHWVNPTTVRATTQSIVDIAGKLDEMPWAEPWFAQERTVQAQYASWAAAYDAPGNPMVMAEEPVVHEILSQYPVGVVLDAACGTGRHAAYMASLGHEVVGIDLTPEMLDVAKAKAPSARFEMGDLNALPLPDQSVDVAVCTLALTHCVELGAAVRELERVVRPGGHVVISDVHPFMVMLGSQAVDFDDDDSSGFTRNYVHQVSDYLAAFQFAGLEVIQCAEPIWGDEEVATLGIGEHAPGLMDAAVKGLPIVIVWELMKRG